MLERQIGLSRAIAKLIIEHPHLELLPQSTNSLEERLSRIFIIVLFRAKDMQLNAQLVQKINASRHIFVSGTSWEGKPACRFAVSNWQVKIERDLDIIKEVLNGVSSKTA
jgi:hypothetical protein